MCASQISCPKVELAEDSSQEYIALATLSAVIRMIEWFAWICSCIVSLQSVAKPS